MGFYIGKQGTLYYQRLDGGLARFGLRVAPDGTLKIFDHLRREWYDVPAEEIPDRSGGHIRLVIVKEDK